MEIAESSSQAASAVEQDAEELLMLLHDARTFLTCIVGFFSLIDVGRFKDPFAVDLAQRALVAGEQCELLLQRMADLLLGTGPARRRGLVELEPLLRQALAAFSALFAAKGVALEAVGLDGRTPVRADGQELRRLIANLLANALKFTGAGGRVRLALRADAGRAEIEVRDDGVGIEERHLPHVFDKFYQVWPHNHGSMGLGLYIGWRIVTALGGTISVASDGVGRGASFKVVLPAAV